MNIHQLSVTYNGEHDRILVRVNTTAGEELRLWLTRRLTLNLWPLLGKVVAEHVARQEAVKSPAVAPVASADDQTKRLLADFKKEETLQKADFKTPFKAEPAAFPLGAEPLLVTELNITPLPTGQLQFGFVEKLPGVQNPRAFQMALEQQMTHGFVHLLDQALASAEWHKVPAIATSAPATADADEAAAPAADKPRYLN